MGKHEEVLPCEPELWSQFYGDQDDSGEETDWVFLVKVRERWEWKL